MMEKKMKYNLAYEILPAVRVSLNARKPWILKLNRNEDMLSASRTKGKFEQWQKSWQGPEVTWLEPEGRNKEKIIQDILRDIREGYRLIMLKDAGLLAAGISFSEVNDALQEHTSANAGAKKDSTVKDKIVVITGAAQGFGKGLAEHFAAEGACVVVADINRKTGGESVKKIIEKTGNEAVVFIPVDVTDSNSMDTMIRQTVFAFGGLDIFVSNAGVLKAGDLETLEEEAFDFLTKVNYKGLYLGTKYAARVMKTQHKYHPGYFMDIVQINSKSGLQGSNRNFAYAGSKFGSIGLIQSFALELVTDNIKVNAVCPGNFFDGPLWSDPEKGLFVQYLKTGKVPGAKSIEDVRKHYENRVPMKRGCFVEDVYKALKYLIEQEYETGQALPVTGGQVMLK